MPIPTNSYQLPGGNPNSVWAQVGIANPLENWPAIDIDWLEMINGTYQDALAAGNPNPMDAGIQLVRNIFSAVPILGQALAAIEGLMVQTDFDFLSAWNSSMARHMYLYDTAKKGITIPPEMVNWALPHSSMSRWNEGAQTWDVSNGGGHDWQTPKYGPKGYFDMMWLVNVHEGDIAAAENEYNQRMGFLEAMKNGAKENGVGSFDIGTLPMVAITFILWIMLKK